ncbi:MAG: type III pantothenate kinase [Candidatus Eisenbacteria bacterium]|uniref:Type III pantothenate kinase n=1 Tax=Eiseniibacteriota bacterium TaxID=2212470 RepID=A0A948RRE9_UNCEI|nr:type III pantothenate kinase [Candidatus Eisenbacteria bacterium]MBU2689628.1 type III pantothenate kinase [Candidatus Eisenbacteria bacterium]
MSKRKSDLTGKMVDHPGTALTLDVGNTHTGVGFFRDGELIQQWRFASRPSATGDELLTILEPLLRRELDDLARDRAVIIGSVVPALTREHEAAVARLFHAKALVLDHRLKLGIRLRVVDPASVGADRIANAIGAVVRGRLPAIVVDMGTATTFDVIDEQRSYMGGVIAPGLETSSENLFRRAARLAKVEIKQPRRFIGKTTEESLQSGLFYGAVGQIDGIVNGIQKELGKKAFVMATGGLASTISGASKTIKEVRPGLTLSGLYHALLLNR